ncbi:MAG: carboxypeptidase-like regulatory domain-containing protein, partial [Winogradskyella sp.]|nr:carboxypeptidase-like regulatory domain-containing protein [Winogradskyella sp.]
MNVKLLIPFFFLFTIWSYGQTKVSGHIYDEFDEPVPYANVIFKGSTIGTITNENGKFYLESDEDWDTLIISFLGFETLEIPLTKKVNYDLRLVLFESAAALDEVVIISGKQPKKNNPAIDILRKIWENKRKNGLRQYDQYQFDKYEKVEFDLNTIDSSVIKSK